MNAGDDSHPAAEVQCLDEFSYLVELGEGKEAPVKTGDGCHPAVGV